MADLTPLPGAACPQCRAAVRPGAPWCTQCYTDLRPAPEPAVVAAPEPAGGDAETDSAGADSADRDGAGAGSPRWPCTTCGELNGFASSTCGKCGAPFLAGLRATEAPLLVVPGVGDIGRLTRTQRLALAGGVILLVLLAVFLLGVLTS